MTYRLNGWLWAVGAWICVILFSSTSLASVWAERVFGLVSGALFGRWRQDPSSYGIVHLLADKGFHVALFCVLAVLLWQAFASTERKPWLIIACGAIVGSSSEFLQRFFPDCDPAIRDVLINIGGTALGVLICIALVRLRRERRAEVLLLKR